MNEQKQSQKQKEKFPETIKSLKKILRNNRLDGEEQGQNVKRTDGRGRKENVSYNRRTKTESFSNGQTGGRNNRSRNRVRTRGRNRSTNKMGTGRPDSDRGGLVLQGTNGPVSRVVKSFTTNLTSIRNETVGITRRGGYKESMPMMNPVITPAGNDAIIMKGSEFLTFLNGYTSADPLVISPSQPGDILALIPLNPQLLAGTRLAQMSSLYQKYKILDMIFEFIPSVPSTQNGSLLFYLAYDPNENPSVMTFDSTERMRIFLSHEGANVFNVYDYGRVALVEQPDSLKSYFVREGEDSRQEMQAYFVAAAASEFTNENATLPLGTIMIHYRVKLETRAIILPVDNSVQVNCTVSATATASFVNLSTDDLVLFNRAVTGAPALERKYLYQLNIINTALSGGSGLGCYDGYGDYGFFYKGSVWFGRCSSDEGPTAWYIYSTFEGALDAIETDAVRWRASLVGADTFTVEFVLHGYSLENA